MYVIHSPSLIVFDLHVAESTNTYNHVVLVMKWLCSNDLICFVYPSLHQWYTGDGMLQWDQWIYKAMPAVASLIWPLWNEIPVTGVFF